MPPRKIFGRNVARIHTELWITQERLCEYADIDRSYLQRIENGTSNPNVEVAERIRRGLDCPWDVLLHGIEWLPFKFRRRDSNVPVRRRWQK